jgi:hypothetical protein
MPAKESKARKTSKPPKGQDTGLKTPERQASSEIPENKRQKLSPPSPKRQSSPFKRQGPTNVADVGGRDKVFHFRSQNVTTTHGQNNFVAVKNVGEVVYVDRNGKLAISVATTLSWLDKSNQHMDRGVHGPNIVKGFEKGVWHELRKARLSFNEEKEVGFTKLVIDHLTIDTLVSNESKNTMLDAIKSNSTHLTKIGDFYAQSSGTAVSMVVRVFSIESIATTSLAGKAKVYDEHNAVEVLIFKKDQTLTGAKNGEVFFIHGKINHTEQCFKKITTVTMDTAFKITKSMENELKYNVPPMQEELQDVENVSALRSIAEALRNRNAMEKVTWYDDIPCRINNILDSFAFMTCEKCKYPLEELNEGLTCTNLKCSENDKIAKDDKIKFKSSPSCELAISQGFTEETVTAKICKNQEIILFGVTAKDLCLGVKPSKSYENVDIKATLGISKKSILVNKIVRIEH